MRARLVDGFAGGGDGTGGVGDADRGRRRDHGRNGELTEGGAVHGAFPSWVLAVLTSLPFTAAPVALMSEPAAFSCCCRAASSALDTWVGVPVVVGVELVAFDAAEVVRFDGAVVALGAEGADVGLSGVALLAEPLPHPAAKTASPTTATTTPRCVGDFCMDSCSSPIVKG